MSTRAKRTERRRGVRVALGSRDEALLRAVGRFRLATSADLHRLFFAGRHRDVLASRLRKLYDAGYLETHVSDRAAPNVYSLGAEGKTWVRAQGGIVPGLPRPPWQHHLAVISVWSRMAAATHQISGSRLTRFVPEFEVREQGIGLAFGVAPDALAEITVARDGRTETVRILLEVDRGNESLAVIRQKLGALAAARVEGALLPGWSTFDLAVVLDAAGARRQDRIRTLLADEWPGPWRVWTEATDLVAELSEPSGSAEATAGASRYGCGRDAAASEGSTTTPTVTGGGYSDE